MSYEIRHKTLDYLKALLPQGKRKLASAKHFAEQMNQAASANQTQTHWHLQQWWILIAGFFSFKYFPIPEIVPPVPLQTTT